MNSIKIIAGFPGVGKSFLFKQDSMKITDSDSSQFDKEYFPQNYITHIQNKIEEGYIVASSTHEEVRDAFVENDMPFYLVYPDISLKDEYLERYRERGSPDEFIDMMDKKWNVFILGCMRQEGCQRIVLSNGQYLSDVIHQLEL